VKIENNKRLRRAKSRQGDRKDRGTHLKLDKNLSKNHLVEEEKEKKNWFWWKIA
jgi:hypothetical protein